MTTEGPAFRWFAWHPVNTLDRGWRWLRMVHRRRVYSSMDAWSADWFETSVNGWDH